MDYKNNMAIAMMIARITDDDQYEVSDTELKFECLTVDFEKRLFIWMTGTKAYQNIDMKTYYALEGVRVRFEFQRMESYTSDDLRFT